MTNDLIQRLRNAGEDWPASLVKLEAEAADEIERLRAALKSCPCPGGGWNGMPKDMEPTIENCMAHDACGCIYGDALRGVKADTSGQ